MSVCKDDVRLWCLLRRLGFVPLGTNGSAGESPADALFEIELLEIWDRRADGWTADAERGPRHLRKTSTLLVSRDESLFDKLVLVAPWTRWQELIGTFGELEGEGFDYVVSERENDLTELHDIRNRVELWQREWFRRGQKNVGTIILVHADDNFLRHLAPRGRPRPKRRFPYHADRKA